MIILCSGPMTPSGRGTLSAAERSALPAPGTEDVRFAAKVKHLQSSFPAAPEEEIAAALVRAANNPLPAKKVRPLNELTSSACDSRQDCR